MEPATAQVVPDVLQVGVHVILPVGTPLVPVVTAVIMPEAAVTFALAVYFALAGIGIALLPLAEFPEMADNEAPVGAAHVPAKSLQ